MPAQVLGAGSQDREWRPKLVRGVGGELALAAQGVADRDQRPLGVHAAQPERSEEREGATPDEHDEEHLEGPHLGRAIGDDLRDVATVGRVHARRQHAVRRALE